MKNLFKKYQALSFNELLNVNGGYSGSSGGGGSSRSSSYTSSSRSSSSSGGYSGSSGGGGWTCTITSSYSGSSSGYISSYAGNSAGYKSGYSACSAYSAYSSGNSEAMKNSLKTGIGNISNEDSSLRRAAMAEKRDEYKAGVFDCDIYVQETVEKSGIKNNLKSDWGDAVNKTCDEHKAILESKGLLNSNAEKGWSVVLMTDGRSYTDENGATKNRISHAALVDVSADGSVTVYQNSKSVQHISNYTSITDFQNDYGYNSFHYYSLATY